MKLIAKKRAAWNSSYFISLFQMDIFHYVITDGTDEDRFAYTEEYTGKEIHQDIMSKFNQRGV